MAVTKNLKEIVLSKYHIDIDKENLLKLFSIKEADVFNVDLDAALAKAKSKWERGINSANEELAAKCKDRLANYDKYAQLIKDRDVIKQLPAYYYGISQEQAEESLDFARTFFKTVASTKVITSSDVRFFLKYYSEESKHKDAILDMVEKELKIKLKESKKEEKETKEEKNSQFVVKRFTEKTILGIRNCCDLLQRASMNKTITDRYQNIHGKTLFEYLKMDTYLNASELENDATKMQQEVFGLIQNYGHEYDSLRDLYNSLKVLSASKDVQDNFKEFKILVAYPDLSPYMVLFSKVTKKTMDLFYGEAKKIYGFSSVEQFREIYYDPLYEHFGITNTLPKTKKKVKRVKKAVQKNILVGKKDYLGILGKILFATANLPVLMACAYFKVQRFIFKHVRVIAALITAFVCTLIVTDNHKQDYMHFFDEIKNHIVTLFTNQGMTFINALFDSALIIGGCILIVIAIYCLARETLVNLNKDFDWEGYDITWNSIIEGMYQDVSENYKDNRKTALIRLIVRTAINIGIPAALFVLI